MLLVGWLPRDGDAASVSGMAPLPFAVTAPTVYDVPCFDSAAAQLRYATACKLRAWSAGARDAGELRGWAVRAFQAVRLHFPDQRALAAEAAFRAGELLRADGHAGWAAVEFRAAIELGERTDFRARARLELGHIERRAGRWSQALEAFESVIVDRSAGARWRDEAALAIGRLHASQGRAEDARRWLQRAAELGEDPLLCVRAYDAWALSYVDAGDPEAAAGVLALARRALTSVALEETELGQRVALALERMSCIARIEDAIARRRRHAQPSRGERRRKKK
jgi:tetratricopeptide (TPR) repeat protein